VSHGYGVGPPNRSGPRDRTLSSGDEDPRTSAREHLIAVAGHGIPPSLPDTIRHLTVRRRTIPAANPFEGTVTRELIHAAKCLRAYFEQVLAKDGDSLSTFLVLDVVAKSEGSTQRELADGVRIEGATMTRHLDRLEEAGLISRRRDPDDRRAILVDLTSAGKKTHMRLRARMTAAHDACWVGISKQDRETVRSVAMKLSENVDALSADRKEVARA